MTPEHLSMGTLDAPRQATPVKREELAMSDEQLLTAAETAELLEIPFEELAQWIAGGVEGLDAAMDVRSHGFSPAEIGVLEEHEVRMMCGRFGDWTEVFKGYSPSEREAMWLEEISSPADIP